MNNPASMASGATQPGGIKKIPKPDDEAASKVYRADSGQLYVPAVWFRASLLIGCKNRKFGKSSARTIIGAAVFNTDQSRCPLVHPKTGKPVKDYSINISRAVVGTSGVLRARPEVPEWACDLDLEIDADFIPNASLIEDILNAAGKIAGVGDNRPSSPRKPGPHGRFSAELIK